MNWPRFLAAFLLNLVLGVVIATAVLGGLGFVLAGREGLVNGAYWGVALGLVGGAISGFVWAGKYWSDFAGRYGSSYLKDELEGERKPGETSAATGRDPRW